MSPSDGISPEGETQNGRGLEEWSLAGAENLHETYRHLALAVPGTELVQDEGFEACVGEFPHAICNFALKLRLDPWSTRRLRDLAASRPVLQVYASPGDGPGHRAELLARQGFRQGFRLSHLVAPPRDPGAYLDLRLVESFEDRFATTSFMAAQFLTRQSPEVRRVIAEAGARAERLEVYELVDRTERIGALTLSRAGGVLGVYNLCVAASKRGKGIGRGMVAWVQALAYAAGTAVTLQCDPRLSGWYEKQGFARASAIDVYSWSKMQQADIMG